MRAICSYGLPDDIYGSLFGVVRGGVAARINGALVSVMCWRGVCCVLNVAMAVVARECAFCACAILSVGCAIAFL